MATPASESARGGGPRGERTPVRPARVLPAGAWQVRAAAKVNLVLRVGPRRPDGYHDLASLMVPLDLTDVLTVEVRARCGPVRCRAPGRPDLDGPSNLAARAAEAFRARFGIANAVAITVEKRIPVTAGLGGGSSDAAAVLRALARAAGLRGALAWAGLAELALGIGSDVPFFLGAGPAWAAGRGERLRPARAPALHLVLAYPRDPSLAIRAGHAYAWLDAARDAAGIRAPTPRVGSGRVTRLVNDLQAPCFQHHPFLATLAGRLVGAGATAVMMSGSGPTVFGTCPDGASARRVAQVVRRSGPEVEVHVVRTVQRHPGVTRWTSPRSASSRSARRS